MRPKLDPTHEGRSFDPGPPVHRARVVEDEWFVEFEFQFESRSPEEYVRS